MAKVRRVSLFRNGRNQAIRIPRDMELAGREALIRRDGDRLVIEPATSPAGLLDFLDELAPVHVDFPEVDEPPPAPVAALGPDDA
ncbi:MAG: antitoxin [Parvularculaceae bacterium]